MRRGQDFFDNFERALQPALRAEVDLVVHGGDLLYRSKVKPSLVNAALEPLRRVCDASVPVILVPGNHERSHIPHRLFAEYPLLHVLDRPRTVTFESRGMRVAVAGFPFARDVASRFEHLLAATEWQRADADIRLLCLHQTIEGAQVGPVGYTFRAGHDIVPGQALPAGFAAVLAGHIHRHQVLTSDLRGRALAAPVLYPGSVERTAFAEREETKGFLTLELSPGERGGHLEGYRFHELPSRPMVELPLDPSGRRSPSIETELAARFSELDSRSIVRLCLLSEPDPVTRQVLRAQPLRCIAPPEMVVEVRWPRESNGRTRITTPRG